MARNSGIVATAMPPAFDHRQIGRDESRIVGRSAGARGRPVMRPSRPTSTLAMRFTPFAAIGGIGDGRIRSCRDASPCPSSSQRSRRSLTQLRRGGIVEFRAREDEFGPVLAWRKMLPRERIDMGCRGIVVTRARNLNLGSVGHRTLLSAWKAPGSTHLGNILGLKQFGAIAGIFGHPIYSGGKCRD